jgi:ferritin-like metal-binding protein YciE
VVVAVMSDQRQDLLQLLQDAYASAQNVERLLRQFSDRHASHAELASPINACLTQTLDQQRLLGECLRRIEDGSHVAHLATADFTALQQAPADQSADDVAHDLARVRALILSEMDLYASGIATAESSGFFETRLVCEEILSQKSSMAAWLSERASSQSAA